MRFSFHISVLIFTCFSLSALPINAEERWSLCPAPAIYKTPELPASFPDGAIQAYADKLEGNALLNGQKNKQQGKMSLHGNVVLETKDEYLLADQADFDRTNGNVNLNGNVEMHNREISLFANSGEYQQKNGLGQFKQARYQLRNTRGNGEAEHIRRPSADVSVLENAIYTTCDVPRPEWAIHTSKLTLNRAEGFGSAKNLRLYLLDTPLFYWPYITFPIDDRRKTGLLYPSLGRSDSNGFEYAQPFYWNIHPQMDATLTPRHISKRGTQLQSEWRLLDRWSHYTFNGEYLDDTKFNDKRWLIGFTQSGRFGHGWSSDIRTRRVSDGDYLDDLGSGLDIGEPQHLLSTGTLSYSGSVWRHRIGIDRYQTLDSNIAPSDRPHRREPFIYSNADKLWNGLNLRFAGSLIRYGHDSRVKGNRLDLYPSISKTWESPGWFSSPKIGVRHTQYQLENLSSTNDKNPSRTTAIFSIDNGLIFERFLANNRVQTLEPRLFALYVPAEDQGQIPLFDTSAYTFSYSQLFRENRFTGADRQGDAKQLSLGLTTRILDDNSGKELLRARIARAYYLDDREVSLGANTSDSTHASDIASDLKAYIAHNWEFNTSLQYSRQADRVERRTHHLRYQSQSDKIANIGYRYVRDNFKQAELSGVLPLDARWTLVGRWLYDIENQRSQETFAGFGYQSCCWAVSLVGRRTAEENNNIIESDNEIMLQITLKGLADLGADNNTLVEESILGYID